MTATISKMEQTQYQTVRHSTDQAVQDGGELSQDDANSENPPHSCPSLPHMPSTASPDDAAVTSYINTKH